MMINYVSSADSQQQVLAAGQTQLSHQPKEIKKIIAPAKAVEDAVEISEEAQKRAEAVQAAKESEKSGEGLKHHPGEERSADDLKA